MGSYLTSLALRYLELKKYNFRLIWGFFKGFGKISSYSKLNFWKNYISFAFRGKPAYREPHNFS